MKDVKHGLYLNDVKYGDIKPFVRSVCFPSDHHHQHVNISLEDVIKLINDNLCLHTLYIL